MSEQQAHSFSVYREMPRAKTRPKQRRGVVKVRVKPRIRKAGEAQGLQASAINYDPKKTQFANFAEAGLLADSNQIGAATDRNRVTGFNPRVKGRSAEPRPADVTHQLELEVPEGEKTIRKVPPGETSVLRRLVEKHGEDYAAMARDMRINTHQQTASHLRKRIAKMKDDDALEEAAIAAARKAGKQKLPRSRMQPRMTRLPNKAFKKGSKNFN